MFIQEIPKYQLCPGRRSGFIIIIKQHFDLLRMRFWHQIISTIPPRAAKQQIQVKIGYCDKNKIHHLKFESKATIFLSLYHQAQIYFLNHVVLQGQI